MKKPVHSFMQILMIWQIFRLSMFWAGICDENWNKYVNKYYYWFLLISYSKAFSITIRLFSDFLQVVKLEIPKSNQFSVLELKHFALEHVSKMSLIHVIDRQINRTIKNNFSNASQLITYSKVEFFFFFYPGAQHNGAN